MTSRMPKQRSQKSVWFWRSVKAICAGACLTFVSQLLLVSTTQAVSFYGLWELDVQAEDAPRYLGDYAPSFYKASLWIPTDDGKTRKLGILKPDFGVEKIQFAYSSSTEIYEHYWFRESHGMRPPYVQISRVRYGWPFRSTYYDAIGLSPTTDEMLLADYWAITKKLAGLRLGFEAPSWWPKVYGVRQIPVVPIPSGFLANTLIYAAVWLLSAAVIRGTRQLSRRRRGACLNCGYQLTGNDRCPECGTKT